MWHNNEKGSNAHAMAERHAKDDNNDKVKLCMPESFDIEGNDSGVVHVGTIAQAFSW
jgi:hypothetical protein